MANNIKARKKLSALYRTGVEVRFGPGIPPKIGKPDVNKGLLVTENGDELPLQPEEVQVWVQPPSPIQREMAVRDAQAARAKSLVRAKRNEDSEEHLTIMAFLVDMSMETLVDYVLLSGSDTRRDQAVREILGEDEWKDISAYQDAMRTFDELEEAGQALNEEQQEEYDALQEQDQKFGDQVAELEAKLMDIDRAALEMQTREQLEKKALDKRSEIVGQQAFMFEYETQMLFYSVRDFDDHGVLLYASARELAEEPEEIQDAFKNAILLFIGDSGEAKNSLGAVSGSESSEPPSEPVISAPSTPEVVNA